LDERRKLSNRKVEVAGASAAETAEWFGQNGPLLTAASQRLLTTPAPPQLLHTDARSVNLRWSNGGSTWSTGRRQSPDLPSLTRLSLSRVSRSSRPRSRDCSRMVSGG